MKLKVLRSTEGAGGGLLQLHILEFSNVAAYFTNMNWP